MAKREIPKATEPRYKILGVDLAKIESDTVEEAPESIIGIVSGCTQLNVRKEPDINAPVISKIREQSKVMIDNDRSTDDWVSICTESGFEGYCMKKYIIVN